MNLNRITASGLAAALLLGLCAQTAMAEDQAAMLDEIVVTAQKRESTLMDASLSVTALTGDSLSEYAITSFNDYIELVPGMSSSDRTPETWGPRRIGIRGVQTLNGTFSVGQSTVGFYIDDTVVPISNPRLVDLERVEVLRGPQGTLYGSATMAGLIKLVTVQPDPTGWSGRILADVSTMEDGSEGYSLEGVVNIPVADTFAVRVSGYADERPGYIDVILVDLPTQATGQRVDDANDVEAYGARIAAAWDATDNLRFNLSHMYNKTEVGNLSFFHRPTEDGLPVEPCIAFNFTECPDPTAPVAELTGPSNDRDDPRWLGRMLTPSDTEFNLTNLTLNWGFSGADLVSSTSYYTDEGYYQSEITDFLGGIFGRDVTVPIAVDPFFAFQPVTTTFNRDLENTEITHETRLVSNWDKRFNYTVGVFYTDRDEDYITNAPLGVGTSLFGFPNLSDDGSALATVGFRGREEFSLFGELTYAFTEQFSATIGGRYYDHTYEARDMFTGNPLFVGDPSGMSTASTSASLDGTLGSLRLSYRPTDSTLIYGSFAEGFRMGGATFRVPEDLPECQAEIQAIFGTDSAPTTYDPDDLENYEIGWKQTWAGGRATTNVSAFYIDWSNTQTALPSLCEIIGFPYNAGAVESSGAEIESQFAVTENFVLGINLAYIDAEIAEDLTTSDAAPPQAVKGDLMPGVPEWTASINWDYRHTLSDTVTGYFRGVMSYRDETVVLLGVNDNLSDDYTMLDLRFGAILNESWDIAVYINNALDERPSLNGPAGINNVGNDPNAFRFQETTLAPRNFGATLTKSFY